MASAVPPQLVRLVPAQSARPAALPPAFVRAATAPPVQMSLREEVASAAPHMCRARADWAVSLLVRSGITSLAILARVPWSEIRGFDRADPEQVRAMQTLMRAAASASLGATNSRRTAGNPPGVGALAGTAVSARRQASGQPQRCASEARSRSPPQVAASAVQAPAVALTRLSAGAACPIQPFAGPRQSVRAFVAPRSAGGRAEWLREASACAILGSCPRSTASIRSGIRCWVEFASKNLGDAAGLLPPALEALLAWSLHFRCAATFANYLGHVKVACLLVGASTDVFKREALGRAKSAIAKRQLFSPRRKLFLRLPAVEALATLAASRPALVVFGKLWILAYAFLLRVPSEALPATSGDCAQQDNRQSCLWFSDGRAYLRLARRKNRPQGSLLWRSCWCRRSSVTCPVHALQPWAAQFPSGAALFPGITAGEALRTLRVMLSARGFADAHEYRTHDFRRGHAEARAATPPGSRVPLRCHRTFAAKAAV